MNNSLNLSQCPVCSGKLTSNQKFKFLEKYSLDDGVFSLFECPLCSVKFWTPFKNPGPEWYEKCTQNLKHRAVNDKEFFLWMAENRGITKHFLENPPHQNPKGLKLLDVGCGTGGFLIEAQKLGYTVTGVDFDPEQIRTAKEFGLEQVFSEDVLKFLEKHPNEFDVITGFEIIEHLDQPREFIRLIHQALKPGGILCLSTPNQNRIGPKNEFWDFPYHHLTRWTKKSLTNIITLESFKNIKVEEELPLAYLVSKFRVGLGAFLRKKTAKKIGTSSHGQYKDTVAKLGSMKDRLLSVALLPFGYLLFILNKKGQGLYLTAQK